MKKLYLNGTAQDLTQSLHAKSGTGVEGDHWENVTPSWTTNWTQAGGGSLPASPSWNVHSAHCLLEVTSKMQPCKSNFF